MKLYVFNWKRKHYEYSDFAKDERVNLRNDETDFEDIGEDSEDASKWDAIEEIFIITPSRPIFNHILSS